MIKVFFQVMLLCFKTLRALFIVGMGGLGKFFVYIRHNHNAFKDVKNNFLRYVLRDNIGLISNAHVAFADVTEKMASCSECLQLSQLFSIAIDSAKTREVAELPKDRRLVRFPHFMEFHAKEKYESKSILGKLYHMAKRWKTISERSQSSYDKEMEVYGFVKYIDEAISLKEHYDSGLMNLMAKYEVENETQFILMYKGDFETLTHEVRQKFEKWGSDNELAKASACYHATHSNDNNNEPRLIGFPLCIYVKLIKIKEQKRPMSSIKLSNFDNILPF